MDTEEIITELFKRTRLSVEPNDPIFLIVELNRIILEQEGDLIAGRVSSVADGFERITRRSADELIDTINKASSVLQAQIVTFEASANKLSVPDYLVATHPPERGQEAESLEGGFKKLFIHWALISSIFASGLFVGLFISGFMWVFFRQ